MVVHIYIYKDLPQILPISKTRPERAEQPGPPVSQSMRGSSFGLFSDSMK